MKELPEGWEEVYLEKHVKIFNGKTPSKKEKRKSGFPVLKIKDIDSRGRFSGVFDSYVDESFFRKYSVKKIRIGDVLLLNAAHSSSYVGTKQYIVDKSVQGAIATGEWMILRSTSEFIDTQYLHYYIQHPKVRLVIQEIVRGIHLYPKDMKKIKIPLPMKNGTPDVEKQRQIVAILEKAERLLQLQEQLEGLLEELPKSVFLEMFGDPVTNSKGWERRPYSSMADKIIDCPHSTPAHTEKESPFPCIRTTELKEGNIHWPSMKYVNEDTYNERTSRLVPIAGDIVFGREGNFGEAIIVPPNVRMCLGQRVMLFRVENDTVNNIYFWSLLRSKSTFLQAKRKSSGSTVGHINVKDIKKFIGPCPPLSIQNQYAEIMNFLSNSIKSNLDRNTITQLHNSLLQKAFAGQLVQ